MSATPVTYLDTNIIIAAYEGKGADADHAWQLLNAIDRSEIFGITSEITLAELLVKPFQRDNAVLAKTYETVVVPGKAFQVVPVSRDVLIEAARMRAHHPGARLPDAIHIATARTSGCGFVVTRDRRFPKLEGIKFVPFGPSVLDDIRTHDFD